MALYLFVNELECLECCMRIMTVIEEFAHVGWNTRMNIPQIERMYVDSGFQPLVGE